MNKLSKRAVDKIMLFFNDKEFDYITLSRREIKILFNVYQNATSEIFELEEQLQTAVNNCKQKDEVIDEAIMFIENHSRKELPYYEFLEFYNNANLSELYDILKKSEGR